MFEILIAMNVYLSRHTIPILLNILIKNPRLNKAIEILINQNFN